MRFTVRRPASAGVSPCSHRPPGGDVACSIHVGVARSRSARFALENRLALTVSRSDVPARRASLRRVRGLVLQTRGEQTPTASADTTIEAALLRDLPTRLFDGAARTAGHATHIKSLDANRVEAPRDVSGDILDPVLAPVSLARPQLRDRALRASSPVRAALRASEALLQQLQPPRLTSAEARGVQQFTRRQGRRHCNTAVDTQHAPVTRTGYGIRNMGERNVPAAGPITCDPVRFHPLRHRPGKPEEDPSDLGHPQTTEPAVQPLDLMRSDPHLPESLVHTGFAPRRAAMRSAEKVPHRLGEVPQRLLLHSLRAGRQPIVLDTSRGQLSTLLVVAGRAATRPPMLLLLDSQIPHIPGAATMLRQSGLLLSGRKQPVSRHASNVTAATDISPKEHAALRPPGFRAATIR